MLSVQEVLCEAGSSINEDKISYGEHFAIVLDGSTGLTKKTMADGTNSARWYVEQIAACARQYMTSTQTIPELVTQCIRDVKQQLATKGEVMDSKVDEPSASIAWVRVYEELLEVFSLGDCSIILKHTDGTYTSIYDERVTKLDNQVIAQMVGISKAEGISVLDARAKVQEQLIANRYKKNQPEGYWILGLDEEAVAHGYYQTFERDRIDTIYMMSDGMAEYYEEQRLAANYQAFIEQLEHTSAQVMYNRLRERQEMDKMCDAYPRLKPKDDVSLIVMKCIKKELS